MAKYKVEGTITIKVEMEVEDDSLTTKPEALEIGSKNILDFYNLNVVGGYHDKDNCIVELDAKRIKKTEL
jgi:hypothetical protein|tara:strand:- start:606 stop:815 length:210 start_codon:yes stop_codon:yes gene_type:complete